MSEAVVDRRSVEPIRGTLGLVRGFFAVRRDPEPFMAGLAHRALDAFPFPLTNRRLLDLGCGTGYLSDALASRGLDVVSTDLSMADLVEGISPRPFCADGGRLPIRGGSIDGVICSNVLEHTPDPGAILAEIERVLRPGGWAWVSWTPWWTPFGGHAIAPLHYLGPQRGLRAYRRVFGEPRGENLPYDGVWPTTVRSVVEDVRRRGGLELLDLYPRYYPWLRAIMRLGPVAEVLVWNCVLLLRRVEQPDD